MDAEESNEQAEGTSSEPAPAQTSKKPTFDRRNPKARAKLLERLPALAYQAWSLRDDLTFDEDWSGMTNLKADSILEPLESIALDRTRNRS